MRSKALNRIVLAISISLSLRPGGAVAADPASVPPAPVDIDLSSTDRNTSTGGANFGSVNLQVGVSTRTVTPTAQLTTAERLAVIQVLSGGQQQLQLGALGNAIGGTVNLSSDVFGTAIHNTVVPAGVTVVHDFGAQPTFSILGNLINSGTLYAVSSNTGVSSATISAGNIINNPGAIISSVLPANGVAGFAASTLNLNLTAVGNIINSGTIASSGNLSLIAGGSIVNQIPTGVTNMTPVLQALGNINLQALNIINSGIISAQTGSLNVATANLVNHGHIESILANINVVNSLAPDLGLKVSSSDGAVIQALGGRIGFDVLDENSKADMSVDGGALLASELNFDAGSGHLSVKLRDVDGAIFVNACSGGLEITDGTHGMNIQQLSFSGDPNLIYSGAGPFSSPGFNTMGGLVDINTSTNTLTGSITFTGDLITTPGAPGNAGTVNLNAGTFISTQNIITSANTIGDGGSVVMNATQGITTGNISTMEASGGTSGSVQLQTTGSGVTAGTIDTFSSGANPSGNVLINAPGDISVVGIKAHNSGGGQAGDLNVVAGGKLTTTALTDGRFITLQSNGDMSIGANVFAASGLTLTTNTCPATLNLGSGARLDLTAGTINITTAHLSNNGEIRSTAASGIISIGCSTCNLVIDGNPTAPIQLAGGGTGNISVVANGGFGVQINSSQRFDAGTTGTVSWSAPTPTGSVSLGANTTQNVTGQLTIAAPNVTAGSNTQVVINQPTGTALAMNSGAPNAPLRLTLPDNSTLQMQSNGGTLTISSPTSVTFSKTPGVGNAVLNLFGSDVTITANNAITIDPNVTVAANTGNMQLATFVATGSPTITINGTLSSSATGNYTYDANNAYTGTTGQISLIVGLFSSYTGPGDLGDIGYITGTGRILETGIGTPLIRLGSGCCTPARVELSGNLTANSGANGRVYIEAIGYVFNPPNIAQLADNATFNVTGQSQLVMPVGILKLGANSSIIADRTSGIAISTRGNFVTQRSIFVKDGASATLRSGGGTITIADCCSNAMTFGTYIVGQPDPLVHYVNFPGVLVNDYWTATGAVSNTTTTLNLNGGAVTVTHPNITINGGMVLRSDRNITFNAGWNPYYNSPATITNNGLVTTSAVGGVVSLSFSNPYNNANGVAPFNKSPGFLQGNGTFSTTGGGASQITVSESTADIILNFASNAIFDPGAAGSVSFVANPATAGLLFANNTTQTVASGAPLTISTPNLMFGGNAAINVNRATGTAVSINDGSGTNDLLITLTAGSTSSINSLGGNIVISPTPNTRSITFSNTNPAGPTAKLRFTGGITQINNAGAGTITVNPFVTVESTFYNNVCCGTISFNSNNMVIAPNATISGAGNVYLFVNNLTHNGIITTTDTVGDQFGTTIGIIENNAAATMILSGTGQFIAAGGGINLQIDTTTNMNVNGSFTYVTGSRQVAIQAVSGGTGTISFAANSVQTINNTNGAPLVIVARNISFGSGALINVSGTSPVTLTSLSGMPLTVTAPSGGVAEIRTAGSTIAISPAAGQNLIMANSNPAGPEARLKLSGGIGQFSTTTATGTVTINPFVTIESSFYNNLCCGTVSFTSSNMIINPNAKISGIGNVYLFVNNLTHNGTITTTDTVGDQFGTTIGIIDNNAATMTLTGSGSLSAAGGTINVQVDGATSMSVNGSYTYGTGAAAGGVIFQSINSAAPVNFGINSVQTINNLNGAPVRIVTNSLGLRNGSLINVGGTSAVNLNSSNNQPLTIFSSAGGAAEVRTAGGTITVQPSSGQNLTFANTAAGGPTATLNFNGGNVSFLTTSPGSTRINSFVNVISNQSVTVSRAFSNSGLLQATNSISFTNSSGFNNNGSLVAPTITLTSPGNVSINGGGTLNSAAATVTSTGGTVTVNQGRNIGRLNGSAATTLNFTTTSGDLNVGNASAPQSVDLTAAATLNVSGTISSGVAQGGITRSTTAVLPETGIVTRGSVHMQSPTGSVSISNSVVTSFGDLIVTAGTAANLGNGNDFVVGGGSMAIYGGQQVNISGGSYRSVAQYQPGTQTLGGQQISNYRGGGILVYSGTPVPNMPALLQGTQSARLPGGWVLADPGTNLTGSTFNIHSQNGGGAVRFALEGVAGKISFTNSVVDANGGAILIDPPGIININGASFSTLAPALTLPTNSSPGTSSATVSLNSTCLSCALGQITVVEDIASARSGPPSQPIATDLTKSGLYQIQPMSAANTSCSTLSMSDSYGDEQAWIVATGDCQIYSVGDQGTTIIGSSGASFANSGSDSVSLRDGRLLVLTGSSGLIVNTSRGSVTIAPESATIVEQSANGVVVVANLAGKPTSIAVKDSSESSAVLAAAGEEIAIGDQSQSSASDSTGGITRSRFNRDQFADDLATLSLNKHGFTSATRKRVDRLLHTEPGQINDSPNALKPIGYVASPATVSAVGLQTMKLGAALIKHDGKTQVLYGSANKIKLLDGEALIAANKPCEIETNGSTIHIAPGAIVLVSAQGNATKVRNLWEGRADSVRAVVGSHHVSAGSGQEVLIGSMETSRSALLKSDHLARRHIVSHDAPNGQRVINSEVSVSSLINNSALLSSMRNSRNSADQQVMFKILKMAACLQLVTARHGAYSSLQKN